jgi:hypothetical protein
MGLDDPDWFWPTRKNWLSKSVFRQTYLPWRQGSRAPLLWLRPLQGTTLVARRLAIPLGPEGPTDDADPAPLVEFGPLRRLSPGESTPPRFANTGYVPSSGFLTLSTACSSPGRPALFQTGGVHGVRSSGVFPRCQVPQFVIAELPPGRFFLRNAHVIIGQCGGAPRGISGTPRAPLIAFGALLQQRIRTAGGLFIPSQTADPLLSFLSPLQGLPVALGHVRDPCPLLRFTCLTFCQPRSELRDWQIAN